MYSVCGLIFVAIVGAIARGRRDCEVWAQVWRSKHGDNRTRACATIKSELLVERLAKKSRGHISSYFLCLYLHDCGGKVAEELRKCLYFVNDIYYINIAKVVFLFKDRKFILQLP